MQMLDSLIVLPDEGARYIYPQFKPILHCAGDQFPMDLPGSAAQNTRDALRLQPELATLRERLQQQLFSGTYDGGRHLPAALSANPAERSKQLRTIGLQDVITVLTGGCLVGWPVWACDDSEPGRLQVCPKLNMLGSTKAASAFSKPVALRLGKNSNAHVPQTSRNVILWV